MLPVALQTTDVIPPPEVFEVDDAMIWCEGNGPAYGHPRVYLRIGESGFADCGYCDRRFVLRGGAADHTTSDRTQTPGRDDLSPDALRGDSH